MGFIKSDNKSRIWIGVLLIIIGTTFGFLFSGKEIYSFNPVINEFIWVQNWIIMEFMSRGINNFYPLIKYGLFVRFGYLVIYGFIVYLLVKVLFKNRKFSKYTLIAITLILVTSLFSILIRLKFPSIYFHYHWLFLNMFLFSYVALTPPLLEVIILTIFAFLESEKKRIKRREINKTIPSLILIIGFCTFQNSVKAESKFINFYHQNDSLRNIFDSLLKGKTPKFKIIGKGFIDIGNQLEGKKVSTAVEIESFSEYSIILKRVENGNSNFNLVNQLLIEPNKVSKCNLEISINHKVGRLSDSIPVYISYKEADFKRKLPIKGFIRSLKDEDLGPEIIFKNSYKEIINPELNKEYIFDFTFKNVGYQDLEIFEIIGENKSQKIDFPKIVQRGQNSLISILDFYTGVKRKIFKIKSNQQSEVTLIINYKFKK